MTLPLYVSHKVVEATRILSITRDSTTQLHTEHGTIKVSYAYDDKHEPHVGGYYVKYVDGYESFSPQEAFENGYKLLEIE